MGVFSVRVLLRGERGGAILLPAQRFVLRATPNKLSYIGQTIRSKDGAGREWRSMHFTHQRLS